MAMLAAYFDESGTHSESSVFVVAGLVSPVEQWKKLSKAWKRELEKYGLEDYHTTQCNSGKGPFSSFSREQLGDLHTSLVRIMQKRVCWRTWAVVVMDDYRDGYKGDGENLPYSLCASGCASQLRHLAKNFDERIPYVFDQGGKGSGLMLKALQELPTTPQGNMYGAGAIVAEDRRYLPPLQAADLHAWECYRYFSGQIAGRDPDLIRKSFQALLEIREAGYGGYIITGNVLVDWLRSLKNGGSVFEPPSYNLTPESRAVIPPRRPIGTQSL